MAADGDLQVVLRSYQKEMVEASLGGNVIVVMPTGSGKTHVGVARVRAELEQSEPPKASLFEKLVWFLANSVELVRQHFETLTLHLPAYRILSLTGQDGVDNWSEQRLWNAVLADVRLVVGTPAVLKDALTHGFVSISRLALLVFDEAHHCIKNEPMNVIMRNFYHPAKSRGEDIPHILGLTASPAINPKEGSLVQLEKNLDSAVATPRRSLEELLRYVYPPHVTPVLYSTTATQYPGGSKVCASLHTAAMDYDFSADPQVIELRQWNDEKSKRRLHKILEKGKSRCSDELRTLDRRATTLYEQLGCLPAEKYVLQCIQRFKVASTGHHDIMLPCASSREQQHLNDLLDTVLNVPVRCSMTDPEISGKAESLISLLAMQDWVLQRGIVFVKERTSVAGLKQLLNQRLDCHVGGFVGTSSFEGRSTLADLANAKQQKEDLADFRSGRINVIVATSVLEEGIDVSACNLVVNFDPPATLIGFLQRRGRARREDSKYYILLPENDEKIDPLRWQTEEIKMKREYMDGSREKQEAESQDEATASARIYRLASTRAMITLDDAKAHLNHFCSVGTSDLSSYTDSRPEYFASQTGGSDQNKRWSATVTLPAFVHPEIRSASSRELWHGEAAAIKDAAFQAYVALHKAGLLNDNLLPFVKEKPEAGLQHVNQPSIVQVAERRSSWTRLAYSAAKADASWHTATVSIVPEHGDPLVVAVALPALLFQTETLVLYWNEKTTYTAVISPSSSCGPLFEQGTRLRQNTFVLLESVHGSRTAGDRRTDFMFLYAGPGQLHAGSEEAVKILSKSQGSCGDLGLVRVASQSGRAYIIDRLQADDQATPELVLTRFPKRKDFLHPVPERQAVNVAYTREESFPVSECTIDNVPLSYAVFAAFVPSIMHRIEVRLLAQELQTTLLREIEIRDTSLIIEAISAPSAGEGRDYNRLEYLGDAILKFCASLHVTAQHLTWPESYLTLEKFSLVRNSTLCQAGLALGVDKYILTKPFTGSKWRPIYVSDVLAADQDGTREMSSKTLADVVEALIGAAFVDGGLERVYRCIQMILPGEIWYSSIESCTRLTPEPIPGTYGSLDMLERLVGHHFAHPTLLVEAITHASLPFQRTGMSYERLEFLGDAVLDLIIVPKLHAHNRRLRHFEMHNIHEALVNGLFLGYCCMSYGIDQRQNAVVRTGGRSHDLEQTARTLHLHDFIRAGGQLLQAKQTSLDTFEKYREPVEGAFLDGVEYPWPDLIAMGPQKFFSDLVESVLGALYIDTKGDLEVCEVFCEKLGILAYMRMMLGSKMDTMSPKERLGVMAGREAVEYHVSVEDGEGKRSLACTVKVAEQIMATVTGCGSKAEAEARAAYAAVQELKKTMPTRKRKLVHADGAEEESDEESGGVALEGMPNL